MPPLYADLPTPSQKLFLAACGNMKAFFFRSNIHSNVEVNRVPPTRTDQTYSRKYGP